MRAWPRSATAGGVRILWSILLVLIFVPGWSGEPRLPLLGRDTRIEARAVMLDSADPSRRRTGDLVFLGGIELRGHGDAFGGFSSLHVGGGRFTLLSDGGNIVRFRIGAGNRIEQVRFAELPGGPRDGWDKRDRDSESMTWDPATGRIWVGFENANQIWRYAPDFARADTHAAPPAMRHWPKDTGPESLVRLADGGMISIAEKGHWPHARGNAAIRFAGDPTVQPNSGFRFAYEPPAGFAVSDAALMPDGRLLVLNRHFDLPFVFSNVLTLVDSRHIRPGALVRGREIARLAPPLIHDNFEGVAVTRENGATIVWLVSDDNQSILQRSLLLKFRYQPEAAAPGAPVRRRARPAS